MVNEKTKFYYGYVLVVAAFIITALTFGINYTFGLFLRPFIDEFGWSRAETSAAYSAMTIVAGFLGIWGGRITDKIGPRIVCVAGGCFLGTGLWLMSYASALWHLYLYYGLIISAGIGGCMPALLSMVSRWFVEKRGVMTGIVTSGTGLGMLIVPMGASRLITLYGWRSSYLILGIAVLVLIVGTALLLKRDPAEIGQLPFGADHFQEESSYTNSAETDYTVREAVYTRQFWIISTIYFGFGVCLHTVAIHVVPYILEMGFHANEAANVIAIIGGANFAGRLLTGNMSDKLPAKASLIITFSLLGITIFWMIFADTLWVLYLISGVFGLAYGGIIVVQPLLLAALFGLNSMGTILGLVLFFYTVGGATGPTMTGRIYDLTGSYIPAFIICIVIIIISIVLILFLKPMQTETADGE